MPVKSTSFRLREPTRRKKRIFDQTFEHYNRALAYVLKVAEANLSKIKDNPVFMNKKETRYYPRKIVPFLNQQCQKGFFSQLNIHSSLKYAALEQVAWMVKGHLGILKNKEKAVQQDQKGGRKEKGGKARKKGKGCSFPRAPLIFPERAAEKVTEKFTRVLTSKHKYNRLKAELEKEHKESFIPLAFLHPDGVLRRQGFSLLYDKKNNEYYALLFLLPVTAKGRGRITGNRTLIGFIRPTVGRINRETGGVLKEEEVSPLFRPPKKPSSAILAPLEFGSWQEENFLHYCHEHPEAVRAAKLIKRDRGYYLNVSFEFKTAPIEPRAVMGLNRGLVNAVGYCVTDLKKGELESGLIEGEALLEEKKRGERDRKDKQKQGRRSPGKKSSRRVAHQLHAISNEIVKIAQRHKAQIVFEDLKDIRKREGQGKATGGKLPRWAKKALHRWDYNKLQNMISYKAESAGLPKPRTVWSYFISITCSSCGECDSANLRDGKGKFRRSPLICTNCEHEEESDINAARNVAFGYFRLLEKIKKKEGKEREEKK